MNIHAETERLRRVYKNRDDHTAKRYDPLRPENYLRRLEKERAIFEWAHYSGLAPFRERCLLDIGCGTGDDLLTFLRVGFPPSRLAGIELMSDNAASARRLLAPEITVIEGDAATTDVPEGSFDVVYQSMVFTSIIDDSYAAHLADWMWKIVKPGGGILWYDFAYGNPGNRDVTGYSSRRLRKLFSARLAACRRVTLAPPIARRVALIHPALYDVFNLTPLLRTHRLCWISKGR